MPNVRDLLVLMKWPVSYLGGNVKYEMSLGKPEEKCPGGGTFGMNVLHSLFVIINFI
jgi:hypothetical protein